MCDKIDTLRRLNNITNLSHHSYNNKVIGECEYEQSSKITSATYIYSVNNKVLGRY